LLLPGESEAFGRAAESVREGFAAAARVASAHVLPVRIYFVSDQPARVIAGYKDAVAAGARFVVGPLTRTGVTALVERAQIAAPTLALNVPERKSGERPNLYTLSLQLEAEARQIARVALRDGRRKALTVTDAGTLGRRMREAFKDEFYRGGGYHIADYAHSTDVAALDGLRKAAGLGVADMVFLALNAASARGVAPYTAPLIVYGTSQLNPTQSGPGVYGDAVEVRFVDMPWMLQPEHPAAIVYTRATGRESDHLERLYALGVDAFRVAQALVEGKRDMDIEGLTGRLYLAPDHTIRRILLLAVIRSGKLAVLGPTRP
jgi:outer membrane PBP1 activator LpoA protein